MKIRDRRLERKKRALRVYELYIELGSLAKVGEALGLTRERVRQILQEADSSGLLKYKTYGNSREQAMAAMISRDEIENELYRYGNLIRLKRKHKISAWDVHKLLDTYKIDRKMLWKRMAEERDSKEYANVLEELGHHPTTTELSRKPKWKALWRRISKRYGKFDNFRQAMGIPIPKKGYARFSQVAKQYAIDRERTTSARLVDMLKMLDKPVCNTELASLSKLNNMTVTKHLKCLERDGVVIVDLRHPRKFYSLKQNK